MTDFIIFGFGLVVTLVVGGALTSLIVVKNRINAEEAAAAAHRPKEPSPTAAEARSGTA